MVRHAAAERNRRLKVSTSTHYSRVAKRVRQWSICYQLTPACASDTAVCQYRGKCKFTFASTVNVFWQRWSTLAAVDVFWPCRSTLVLHRPLFVTPLLLLCMIVLR